MLTDSVTADNAWLGSLRPGVADRQRGIFPFRRPGHCFAVLIAIVCRAPLASGESSPKLPSEEALNARLLGVAGAGFRVFETDHFTIAFDTSFDALRPLTGRLEGTHDAIWRFCDTSKLGLAAPSARLAVILFDRFEDFSTYADTVGVAAGSIAGFYHPRTNIAAFCNTLNSPDLAQINATIGRTRRRLELLSVKPNSGSVPQQRQEWQRALRQLTLQRDLIVKRFNRFVIQHEAAHQAFFNIGVHVRGGVNPLWLVEGLACQFEVPQGDLRGGLTRINQMRLGDFRTALGVDPTAGKIADSAYENAFGDGRLARLGDLVCDPAVFNDAGEHRIARYAQAWALVTYLQRERRAEFAAYLRRLGQRAEGGDISADQERDAFEKAFGPLDDAWESRFVGYMLKLRYTPGDG